MIFQNLNLDSSEIDKVRDIQHPVLVREGQVLIHLKTLGPLPLPGGDAELGSCPLELLYRLFLKKLKNDSPKLCLLSQSLGILQEAW